MLNNSVDFMKERHAPDVISNFVEYKNMALRMSQNHLDSLL